MTEARALRDNPEAIPNEIPPSIPDDISAEECTQSAIQTFLDPFVDAPPGSPPRPPKDAIYETSAATLGDHEIAFCETQGVNQERFYMEDKHLTAEFTIEINGQNYPVRLAGVFDGHGDSLQGGALAAIYLQRFYVPMLKSKLEQCHPDLTPDKIANALIQTTVDLHENWIIYCDQKMQTLQGEDAETLAKRKRLMAGSTASVLLDIGNNWYTSNVGDSRIILVDPNGKTRQVTADHTPENQETEIVAREGILDQSKKKFRAEKGGSSCSSGRSIGDCYLKADTMSSAVWIVSDNGVNPRASVLMIPKEDVPENSCFVISCDGVYEHSEQKVGSTRQVGSFVSKRQDLLAHKVAEDIARRAIKVGCRDNCTVGIVKVHYAREPA